MFVLFTSITQKEAKLQQDSLVLKFGDICAVKTFCNTVMFLSVLLQISACQNPPLYVTHLLY